MRISLVIYEIGCGGAERVMSILANELARRGHEITLHVMNPCEPFFKLDKKVKLAFVGGITPEGSGVMTRVLGLMRRNRLLKESIVSARPNVALSFIVEMNARTLKALNGTGIPVVVSERTFPPMQKLGWFFSKIRKIYYPSAAAVVVQTKDAAEWALEWISDSKVKIIPNPVASMELDAVSEPDWMKGFQWVLSMGRLSKEKGFDLLIESFSMIAEKHPDWKLLIMGEGPERELLLSLIKRKNMEDRIIMKPPVSDIKEIIKGSSVYVLCSRFEGFPNALCEAMSGGLPAVAFDCKAGPGEIVRDGIDGILVEPENVARLSEAVEKLINDEKQRLEMATRAKEVSERFSNLEIICIWEKLLIDCAKA